MHGGLKLGHVAWVRVGGWGCIFIAYPLARGIFILAGVSSDDEGFLGGHGQSLHREMNHFFHDRDYLGIPKVCILCGENIRMAE